MRFLFVALALAVGAIVIALVVVAALLSGGAGGQCPSGYDLATANRPQLLASARDTNGDGKVCVKWEHYIEDSYPRDIVDNY